VTPQQLADLEAAKAAFAAAFGDYIDQAVQQAGPRTDLAIEHLRALVVHLAVALYLTDPEFAVETLRGMAPERH
jgi:hypothetical protein